MAYYNKIGLLVLNKNNTKFLVCEKGKGDVTQMFIMPGGQLESEAEIDCLKREIKEELNTEIKQESIHYLGEYLDSAAGAPKRDVSIKLYTGVVTNIPTPSQEIKKLHWVGKNDIDNKKVSPIIKNKIIPDLVKKNILY